MTYCGRECQIASWKNGHKQECQQFAWAKGDGYLITKPDLRVTADNWILLEGLLKELPSKRDQSFTRWLSTNAVRNHFEVLSRIASDKFPDVPLHLIIFLVDLRTLSPSFEVLPIHDLIVELETGKRGDPMPVQAETLRALRLKVLNDGGRVAIVFATTWHKEGRTFSLMTVSLKLLRKDTPDLESALSPMARCRTVYRYDNLPIDRHCDDVDRALHMLGHVESGYWCDDTEDGERISDRVNRVTLEIHGEILAGYSDSEKLYLRVLAASEPPAVISQGEKILEGLTFEDVFGANPLHLDGMFDSLDRVDNALDREKALHHKLKNRR